MSSWVATRLVRSSDIKHHYGSDMEYFSLDTHIVLQAADTISSPKHPHFSRSLIYLYMIDSTGIASPAKVNQNSLTTSAAAAANKSLPHIVKSCSCASPSPIHITSGILKRQ